MVFISIDTELEHPLYEGKKASICFEVSPLGATFDSLEIESFSRIITNEEEASLLLDLLSFEREALLRYSPSDDLDNVDLQIDMGKEEAFL